MADRIACINPNCRRTAPADKYEQGVMIICGKCFRAIPARFRQRYRELKRRGKRLTRLVQKPRTSHEARAKQWDNISDQMDRADRVLWDAMRAYFTDAAAPPAGLDNFLKETGIGL